MSAALIAALAGGCLLPTDRSADLRLAFDAPPKVFVGDTVQLRFHALDSATARVIQQGFYYVLQGNPAGALEVIGVSLNPAVISVEARLAGTESVSLAVTYAAAPLATVAVTVLDSLRIDSIAAATSPAYVGDTLRVYGVGLDPTRTAVTVGGFPARFVDFRPDSAGRIGGPSRLRVLVPAAGAQSRVTARRGQASSTAAVTLTIAPGDRLEPNDAAPHDLGVLVSDIRLSSLMLEGTGAGSPAARDWYTFTNPTAQPVTLVLKPEDASVAELYLSLTDSLDAFGNRLPGGWSRSVLGNSCLGTVIGGYNGFLDSQVVAVGVLPAGTYHVMIQTGVPVPTPRPYELRIERGYHSLLPPDPYSSVGNDVCQRPASWDIHLGNHGTIENVGTVDWYSLVPAARGVQFYLLQEGATPLATPVLDVLLPTGEVVLHAIGSAFVCLPTTGTILVAVSGGGGVGSYVLDQVPQGTACTGSVRGRE